MAVDLYEDLAEAIADDIETIESVIKAGVKVEKAISDTLEGLEREYPKTNNVKLLLKESESRNDLDRDILNQIKNYLGMINDTLEKNLQINEIEEKIKKLKDEQSMYQYFMVDAGDDMTLRGVYISKMETARKEIEKLEKKISESQDNNEEKPLLNEITKEPENILLNEIIKNPKKIPSNEIINQLEILPDGNGEHDMDELKKPEIN